MSKILILVFLFFGLIFQNQVFSNEDIKIISRENWGANESYRYLNGPEWRDILEKRKTITKTYTSYEKKIALKEKLKNNKANNFLVKEFADIFDVDTYQRYEGDYKLAWPISTTKTKKSIVIHHTDGNYTDSYKAIRNIYKYHSLRNQWGDIGYNYLIGLDGEIFEGRAGGDNVVAGHDKWNNHSSIGIAIIGNYHNKNISSAQDKSLKKLINHLIKKYNINLSKKVPYFKRCIKDEICDEKPIVVSYDYPIIGHRDAGITNCPGDKLYEHLLNLKNELVDNSYTIKKITRRKIENKLKNIQEDKLISILANIEEKINKTNIKQNILIFNNIKSIILNTLNVNNLSFFKKNDISFDDNNKIKVKLSYPLNDNLSINLAGKYKPNFKKNGTEYLLGFLPGVEKKDYKINFNFLEDKLFMNNIEVKGFTNDNFFRIKSPGNNYLTISSWDRKPTWDKSGIYNDNKFKGDIIIYKNNGKLTVINELYLTDYLKGLGEVSDSTNKEKIRSIITLARTYARWYMTMAEKFPGEFYHASDDPNVFQKYLGYGLELRSPNINKIVDETKDLVVTYKGQIIKPWYFSTSNGYTKSFLEYCNKSKGIPDCSNPDKFPFLSSVKDFGGEGKIKNGHGVGVPGTGIEYFSSKGWNYPLIIKYFLKGVNINYM